MGVSLSLHTVVLNRPDLGRPFVGLDNYIAMFRDPVMGTALRNTVVYVVVGVVLQFIVGLIAAALLNRKRRHIWVARTIRNAPVVPATDLRGVHVRVHDRPAIRHPQKLLGAIGIDIGGQGILADPQLALWGAMAVELWRSYPFFALFLLAGLQGIPADLAEASSLRRCEWMAAFPVHQCGRCCAPDRLHLDDSRGDPPRRSCSCC